MGVLCIGSKSFGWALCPGSPFQTQVVAPWGWLGLCLTFWPVKPQFSGSLVSFFFRSHIMETPKEYTGFLIYFSLITRGSKICGKIKKTPAAWQNILSIVFIDTIYFVPYWDSKVWGENIIQNVGFGVRKWNWNQYFCSGYLLDIQGERSSTVM